MATSGSPRERRRPNDPRFSIRVPLLAESPTLPDQHGEGICLDLSRKGASLRLDRSVGVGSTIRVTLRLYAVPLLRLEGRIAWVRQHPDVSGWGMGIEFDGELPGELVAEIGGAKPPPGY